MRNQRGSATLLTVVLALAAALLAAALLTNWVLLDVKTAPPEDVRIVLPVPLNLVKLALRAVPSEELRVPVPAEAREGLQLATTLLRELERCPDGVLLRVNSPDAQVRITAEGGKLRLDVDADGTTVRGRVEVAALAQMLQRMDADTFHPAMALDLLAAAGHGEILAVDSPEARVRITAW